MLKKLSIGIILSVVLMFGYCTFGISFMNPVIASDKDNGKDEDNGKDDKKDEGSSGYYRAGSVVFTGTIVANEDVCEKCGEKKEHCTCENE